MKNLLNRSIAAAAVLTLGIVAAKAVLPLKRSL